MQSQSNCVRSTQASPAFTRPQPPRGWTSAHVAPATATMLDFSSGKTRYRGRPQLSADPVRVLIVAGFADCMAISALIHSIGRFATRSACSANTAIRLGGEFSPDIVLLTTDLPDLSSYRVASALRWGMGRPFPRLIAVTDDMLPRDRQRAMAAGFEQYLALPIERTALQDVLQNRSGPRNCSN